MPIKLIHSDREFLNYFPLSDFCFIWEFSVDFPHIYSISLHEAYTLLKETSILNHLVYEVEMQEKDIFESEDYSRVIYRPFLFDTINFEDFDTIGNIGEFKSRIKEHYIFKKEDVSDIELIGVYRDLYDRIVKKVAKKTSFINGALHISKDRLLKVDESKLDEFHEIHSHYELFIELDRERQVVRIFDIGDD